MAEWLVRCGIATAAMESTGVCWIPACGVLEQHGRKATMPLPPERVVIRHRIRRAAIANAK